MPDSGVVSLYKVSEAVVEHLKDEPVLLGGMGAGALIAAIAVVMPSGAQVYAWIIGGLMLIICLARLAVTIATQPRPAPGEITAATGAPKPERGSNVIVLGDRSEIEDTRIKAPAVTLRSGKRTKIKGSTIEGGM